MKFSFEQVLIKKAMDQLFVEIEICTKNAETEIFTSTQSFMALYVYKFLDEPDNIKLVFVRGENCAGGRGKLKLNSETLRRELTEEQIICKEAASMQAIRDLKMPIYVKDGCTYIAGICAVCRELVARQGCSERRKLLGFKNSCLLAPSEASIWTRFCEVNVVKAIEQLLHLHQSGQIIEELPKEVPRFERHMNEPVRMHNIYKLAREQAKLQCEHGNRQDNAETTEHKKKGKVTITCTIPKEQLPIEHRFAEGVVFTIADLILYASFRMIFQICAGMLQYFPLISTWLSEIDTFEPNCKRVLCELYTPLVVTKTSSPTSLFCLKIPDCEATSLYKSDPKRYKPRNRIFTEQDEVDSCLAKLQTLQLDFTSESDIIYNEPQLDWQTIEPNQEQSSALPQDRLMRKRQQLENLANAVISLTKPGECIVDFCSGTGHLGILLALQLPQCTIILMDNKAISLERARKRSKELNLENCRFYQCNIDYFEGKFDVGTSLHACGSATDIVLQQCIRSRAKFVCCPCCYGSLQPMPHIIYPLSQRFRTLLDEKAYLHIAHTADQAHELGTLNCRPETTRQGQLCMDIVDTDRKLQAEEAGYEVVLTRLKPEQCTPKNRLLVGRLTETS